jgi:hypothetical protein
MSPAVPDKASPLATDIEPLMPDNDEAEPIAIKPLNPDALSPD